MRLTNAFQMDGALTSIATFPICAPIANKDDLVECMVYKFYSGFSMLRMLSFSATRQKKRKNC